MSSSMCQSTTRLFLQFEKGKTTNKQVRRDARTTTRPTITTYEEPDRRTYRPSWKSPHLPFFLKVRQHFAVQLVLVQQRFDPVCVVLQVLQQHLQIPAPTPNTSHVSATVHAPDVYRYSENIFTFFKVLYRCQQSVMMGTRMMDLLFVFSILPVLGDVKQLVE